MKHLKVKVWLAVLVAAAFASGAQAQGTISFNSGYPTGGSAGVISTKGKFALDCGWTLSGSTATVSVWQDGCLVSTDTLIISLNSFAGGISGLQSCATYNVTVEITVVDSSCNTATIRTAIATATAP